mmetsp:Transcript_9089/g.22305  ORF Transcript_9089/g.22305 Transcript_9089/m.22305 type:complete len:88 (+) Transcript_9089:479-742(+)
MLNGNAEEGDGVLQEWVKNEHRVNQSAPSHNPAGGSLNAYMLAYVLKRGSTSMLASAWVISTQKLPSGTSALCLRCTKISVDNLNGV